MEASRVIIVGRPRDAAVDVHDRRHEVGLAEQLGNIAGLLAWRAAFAAHGGRRSEGRGHPEPRPDRRPLCLLGN